MSRGVAALKLEASDARFRAPSLAPNPDYDFLLGTFIDRATLERATALARQWGVLPHDVLIASGWIGAEDYARALAANAGLRFRAEVGVADLDPSQGTLRGALGGAERLKEGGVVLAPERKSVGEILTLAQRVHPEAVELAPLNRMNQAIRDRFATALAHAATGDLAARRPSASARQTLARWQVYAPLLAVSVLVTWLLADAGSALRAISLFFSLLFIPAIALRIVAFRDLVRGEEIASDNASRIPDDELPVYTILVALFREAKVLPQLLRALTRFDYPAAKLDIKIVLEACDTETIEAAAALDLPGNVEIVVVPELEPRTKPRALNYALPLARGEYLVVYDAEDRPDPGQLRKAIASFREGPPNLACLQGRLELYNAQETWFTRQFSIEYCALFSGLLPALDRLGVPFPLGGSTNHFRVSALKWLLAWDPYNVTEDADLGTRLARGGYIARMLDSTTQEEAPCRFMMWLRQRTRWLKGYMQTWLVHMREPAKLWRELGPWGFASFQIMIGGTVLSALVHPWFYFFAAIDLSTGHFAALPESVLGLPFWAMACLSLGSGYVAAMGVGLCALRSRGKRDLIRQVPLMPVYWLLVSAAAYRALWQFASAERFKWEKTEHGVSRQTGSLRSWDAVAQDAGWQENGAGEGNRTLDT